MTTSPRSAAGERSQARIATLLAGILALGLCLPASSPAAAATGVVAVIVREAAPGDLAERLVEVHGGAVTRTLSIIDGFAAELPAAAVARLASHPAIASVTPDAPLQLQTDTYAAGADIGSMHSTARLVGAHAFWARGFTGAGIDVAIIDSGVSPVMGLDEPGKVVRGPDLSFESQAPNLRYLDTFGHGTFMAGLIAGHDPGTTVNLGQAVRGYSGIAPGARIVSVKVADARGATDVSQVIAAIDWVVQHRRDAGMDIRVLNLSFGTYGSQPYALDPLAFAAEVAWHSGIFVVVSAGNNPPTSRLMNPAVDPFVMAVGAADPNGTVPAHDDVLLRSSARGDGVRNPDLVAPGRSVQGLRVPGSYVDLTFPGGRISDRFFRGSGTSQAAAIVSGAAALVIDQRPEITPDELKRLLTSTARRLPAADARGQGAGLIQLDAALASPTVPSVQTWARSTGTGLLERSRGPNHLVIDGVMLEGERDIFGRPFDSAAMAAATLTHTTWTGGTWNGSAWTGDDWAGGEWPTVDWTGVSWSGNEWSSYTWSGNEWSGNEWSGNEWSGNEWSGNEWSANEWSANEWSSHSWQSAGWPSGE